MTKHSPENERIKRQYFAYLKEAKRHSESTVDAAAKALSRFEEYTDPGTSSHCTLSRRLPLSDTWRSRRH